MQREAERAKLISFTSDACISWPDAQSYDTEWLYPAHFFLISVAPKEKQWFRQ